MRVKYLLMKKFIKSKIISNFTLSNQYGRFGNNLQQISLGIMFSNLYKKNFYIENIENINKFSVVNNSFSNILKKYRFDSRFYFFDPYSESYIHKYQIDLPLKKKDSQFYRKNFYKTFKEYIYPNITYKKDIELGKNTIVLHIRSGDIFNSSNQKNYFIQNPLNYYLEIIKSYQKVLIVSSDPQNNPVIEHLKKINKVDVVSNSFEIDFNILMNARNLATSGVGTFAIAAALSSNKIENLYYSNIYFNHHLNPDMIENVIHHKYQFENYINIGSYWDGTRESINKMLSNEVKVRKIEN